MPVRLRRVLGCRLAARQPVRLSRRLILADGVAEALVANVAKDWHPALSSSRTLASLLDQSRIPRDVSVSYTSRFFSHKPGRLFGAAHAANDAR